MKFSLPPRSSAEPIRSSGDSVVRDQADRQAASGGLEPSQAQWRKLAGDSIRQSLALPERVAQKKAPEQQARSSSTNTAANMRQPSARANDVNEDAGTHGRSIVVLGSYEEGSGQGGSSENDGDRDDSRGDQHLNTIAYGEVHASPTQNGQGANQTVLVGMQPPLQSEPRSMVTIANGGNNDNSIVRDQTDRQAVSVGQEASQMQWRELARDSARQSLPLPERVAQKKAPEQQARSSSAHAATNLCQSSGRAMEADQDIGAHGRSIVVVGSREEGSGQGGSSENDADHDGHRNDQHLNTNTIANGESHALSMQSGPNGYQVVVAGANAPQRSEPHSVVSTTNGGNHKLHGSRRAHLHSESVAILIEELLSLNVSGIHKQPRLSESKGPQAVPKANAREKRRIQQAFAVTDGITIIAMRTSQNNPDQHQSRSLLDALVDLLYLLIDLLNPVVDLIDPVARRAAWSQLSQLAFMTPYAAKLRTTCETAMSLLDESA
jgi:hypothetical protein